VADKPSEQGSQLQKGPEPWMPGWIELFLSTTLKKSELISVEDLVSEFITVRRS
jgi:hypothetical protein